MSTSTLDHILALQVSHASYFQVKGDKWGTESGVVIDWLRATSAEQDFVGMRKPAPNEDPPDVVLKHRDGKTIGVELTELVDQKSRTLANRRNKSGNTDPVRFKDFTSQELAEWVGRLVENKSKKPLRRTCDRKVLVIYSDEPSAYALSTCPLCIQTETFFDEVWLVLPPSPNISGSSNQNKFCRANRVQISG